MISLARIVLALVALLIFILGALMLIKIKNSVIGAYAEIEKSKKSQNAKREQTGIIANHAGSKIED